MANTVKLKRSATPSAVPTTGQLDLGEIAINTYDGKVYIKKDDGTAAIVEVGAGGGGGSGTVTSVAISSADGTIDFTGSPITTSGTIDLSVDEAALDLANIGGDLNLASQVTGVLDEVNGGTGQSTITTGDILYGSASNTLSKLAAGTDGQVLTLAAGIPSWAAGGGGGGGSTYYKDAVRVATTAAGTLSSAFANGQSVDGVTLVTGNRILIKNQSSAVENGIYTVNASGAPTRATDFDTDAEVLRGCQTYVQYGTINAGANFQVWSSNATPIVVGTSTIVFGPVQQVATRGAAGETAPTATGDRSIAIGPAAAATNTSAVAIGRSASASGTSGVAIGFQAAAAASNSIGILGNCSGQYSIAMNGNCSGSNSIVLGQQVTAKNNVIFLTGGTYGSSWGDFDGQISFSTGYWDTGTTADQPVAVTFVPAWQTSTNATPIELGCGTNNSNTPTNRIALSNDSTYLFDCDIVARNTATDTESKVWNVKFGIRRGTNAASTALIGTPTKTVYGEDTGTNTWDVSVTADTTNGRPNISVTGEASKTIRWVCNIRMTKVSG